MLKGIKAVIFDMDGIIIDSEPLWRKAMIQSFNEIGIPFSDEECRITTGMRFIEVAEYWFTKHNVISITVKEFDDIVITRLCQLIETEGKLLPGVKSTLEFLKVNGYKIAIGTSSNVQLMNTVIKTLQIESYFNAVCSAQFLQYGKPHPEVFLNCANELKVLATECLVIEDSFNGIIAAKASQMKVLAVPDEENKSNPKFIIADYRLNSLEDFASLLN